MTDATSKNLRRFLKSDDLALVRMGLSMAKGSGVPDEILKEILWMHIIHKDSEIQRAAKSTFMKLAPKEVKQIVKDNWKATYNLNGIGAERLCELETKLRSVDFTLWRFLRKFVWHKNNALSESVRSLMMATPSHWKKVCLEILKDGDLFQGLDDKKVRDGFSKELKSVISELESGGIPLTHTILSEGPVYEFMIKLDKKCEKTIEHKPESSENLRKFLESDDPGMYRMGLSMAKGAGLPEDLLGLLLLSFFETNSEEEIRKDIYRILENDAPSVIRPLIANFEREYHKENTFGKWSEANWHFWINSPKRGRLQEDTLGIIVGLKYWHSSESVRKVATHTLEAEAPELMDKLNLLNNPTKCRIYEVLSEDALMGCLSFIEKIRLNTRNASGKIYKKLFSPSKLLNLSHYDFYQVTQGNKYITNQNIGPLLESSPQARWIVACALTEASLYTELTIENIMENSIELFWESIGDYHRQLRKRDRDLIVEVIKSLPLPLSVHVSKSLYNFAIASFKDKEASAVVKRNRKMITTIFEDPDLAKDILGQMS